MDREAERLLREIGYRKALVDLLYAIDAHEGYRTYTTVDIAMLIKKLLDNYKS